MRIGFCQALHCFTLSYDIKTIPETGSQCGPVYRMPVKALDLPLPLCPDVGRLKGPGRASRGPRMACEGPAIGHDLPITSNIQSNSHARAMRVARVRCALDAVI